MKIRSLHDVVDFVDCVGLPHPLCARYLGGARSRGKTNSLDGGAKQSPTRYSEPFSFSNPRRIASDTLTQPPKATSTGYWMLR